MTVADEACERSDIMALTAASPPAWPRALMTVADEVCERSDIMALTAAAF